MQMYNKLTINSDHRREKTFVVIFMPGTVITEDMSVGMDNNVADKVAFI